MSREFNTWLAETWKTLDPVTAAMWHNFYLLNSINNLPADQALGYNVAYVQPHVLAYSDHFLAQSTDRRLPQPMPSCVDNFDGLYPQPTVIGPNCGSAPFMSWPAVNCLTDFSIPYGQMKARRSYWTGKPQRRRNLRA
jgi:hypothetical protein